MKAKYAFALLVFGYCLDFAGGLFKILHLSFADSVLVIAACLKVAGALLILYKLTDYPPLKSFMDS